MKIEYLSYYEDDRESHPTTDDIIEKINQIIQCINSITSAKEQQKNTQKERG